MFSPIYGDQDALELLAHEVRSRANGYGYWIRSLAGASRFMTYRRHRLSASRRAGASSRDRGNNTLHTANRCNELRTGCLTPKTDPPQ